MAIRFWIHWCTVTYFDNVFGMIPIFNAVMRMNKTSFLYQYL
jgi:hypothetical protein